MWGYFLISISFIPFVRGDDASSVVNSCNQFSLDLLAKVQTSDANVFFSPFSICACLAMVLSGAKGNTAAQLKHTFHYKSDQNINSVYQKLLTDYQKPKNSEYRLSVANRIYASKDLTLKKNFKFEMHKYFDAPLKQIDFTTGMAESIINEWVAKQTEGKIRELFEEDSFDADTKIVLANAIYFKGTWQYKFPKRFNEEVNFRVSRGKRQKTTMMTLTSAFYYEENRDLNAKTLLLPYKGNRLNMFLILPNDDFGLSNVLEKLEAKHFQIKGYLSLVEVKIPKFKLETHFDLKEALKKLKSRNLFTDFADLSGISDDFLKISDIQHKAYIYVDETGTEAAASTGAMGTARSSDTPTAMEFYCDHPFYFAVIDQISKLVLFSGIVRDPGKPT